jgi:hypothetical protein
MRENPKNNLLQTLSIQGRDQVFPKLTFAQCPRGTVIVENEQIFPYVYFPDSGLISSVIQSQSKLQIEVGIVGREGFVGIPLLFGVDRSDRKVFSQMGGQGWKMAIEDFRRMTVDKSELQRICNLFVLNSMNRMTQTIACNKLHTVEQRCARWLLIADDSEQRGILDITPYYLAMIVGGAEPVAPVLAAFNSKGLIECSEQFSTVKKRQSLEKLTCNCYFENKEYYERTMLTATPRT